MSTWYRAGTVTVTNSQTTVTGAGTAWIGAINVGDGIVLPDGRTYEIVQITSATGLVIATPYLGVTAAAQAYAVIPTRGLTVEFNENAVALLTAIQDYVDGALAGRFPSGAAANPSIGFAARPTAGLSMIPGANAAAAAILASINGIERMRITQNGAQITGLLSGTAVTQSATDTTTGRLLKVGDFGIGRPADAQTVLPNLDAFDIPPGMHTSTTVTLGTKPPINSSADAVLVLRPAGNQTTQILSVPNGSVTYIRKSIGNVSWAPWRLIYDQGSVVGVVSNTGAAVTGALFQNITGPNGEAERRASGWMDCLRTNLTVTNCNTAAGAVFQSGDVTWTFPSSFAAGLIPVLSVTADNGNVIGFSVQSISNTAVTFRLISHTAITGAITIRAAARGRWSTLT